MDRQVVVGVAIVRGLEVLAALRAGADGGWEFPGGKVEPGESDVLAAEREIQEELGLRIRVGASLGHEEPVGDKYLLRVHLAELADDAVVPVVREHSEIRWVPVGDLHTLRWLPADLPFLAKLRERLLG